MPCKNYLAVLELKLINIGDCYVDLFPRRKIADIYREHVGLIFFLLHLVRSMSACNGIILVLRRKQVSANAQHREIIKMNARRCPWPPPSP